MAMMVSFIVAGDCRDRAQCNGLVSNHASLCDSGKRCGRGQATIMAGSQDRGSVSFARRWWLVATGGRTGANRYCASWAKTKS